MSSQSSGAAASGGQMTPLDLELCREAVATLSSAEHSKKNFLFLEPVDLQLHPTYTDVVKRPMDLGTLSKNLEAGMYPNREAFFSDAMLCFQNALTFHKGNKQTQWIITLAKEMMKLVTKERRNADKKAKDKEKGTKKQTKRPSASSKSKAKKGDTKNSEKTGLKIKLPVGNRGKEAAKAPTAAATSKPKIKLKGPGASSDTSSTKRKESTQPKLKLKLSLSKNKTSSNTTSATTSAPSRGKVPPPEATKSTSTKPATNKIRLSASSRGKELPKGVSATTAPARTKQQKKAPPKKADGSKKSSKSTGSGSTFEMNTSRKAQCMKVLSGLKRRQANHIVWFNQPVSDKAIVDDYRAKIPNPMDLGTMSTKLEKNQYATIADFVLDLRRIFANCLRYNTTSRDEFRPIAIEMMATAEELMAYFIAKSEQPAVAYPPLLYCWKTCAMILDSLLNVKNPADGHQTAHYFLHPVEFYFGGTVPSDYASKVKRPMDLGTVTSLLLEGKTQSVKMFAENCQLVMKNCISYYEGREGGAVFTEQASRLNALMSHQLHALMLYDTSAAGATARDGAVTWKSVQLQKPPPTFLLSIISELRAMKYTDRSTRITEPAMGPFEKPVNLELYPDYSRFVENPIDLQTVERKVKAGLYLTPEDFEYDVSLIFRNCEAYNVPRRSEHIVAMGKYGAKTFRKLFSSRMKSLEHPEPEQTPSDTGTGEERKDLKRSLSPSAQQKFTKKVKIETESAVVTGKAAPRILIQASAGKGPRSKSPKTSAGAPKRKSTDGTTAKAVPLHVAIAQVKERFPFRRPYKLLESWESACARFFRELMKHPWISAARPKFIFHVPVPVVFPELEKEYRTRVHKPMDLTTAEAKLLQGNIYHSAQDFVDEVALVFANAITFNHSGHEIGEPMSCAYYDASIHLLRYTRWLSLELLTPYLSDDPHVDEVIPNKVPPTNWKLSKANKKKAREEIEAIVLNEPIDRSLEGDRFTWMEAECEKLLKALRHQSDLKYMTFFIYPNYPADYAAFISKPMDWERVQRTLSKREYHTFGEIIEDLRLIFTNALKYNARDKGKETVSGRAYDSAIYMSKKLEVAIDKMLLTVSDRLERERIDHATAEREIEAAERAERERIRERLRKEGENAGNLPDTETRIETIETVRVLNRRPTQRRELLDFDYPYFDEDDGRQEQSHVDAQKGIFERQRRARSEMQKATIAAGALVFQRLAQRAQAFEKAREQQKDSGGSSSEANGKENQKQEADKDSVAEKPSSSVLSEGRAQISIRLKPAKPKKRRKTGPVTLE